MMLKRRILPHKHLWWQDPVLPKREKTPSKSARNKQSAESYPPITKKRNLSFEPSKRWKRYVDLESVDLGYIVELYSLAEIAKRYGLSQYTRRYWRMHILPEPYTKATTKNGVAYFWSRIQLTALDAVLKHLEANGLLTIRQHHVSVLGLLDHGCEFLEKYYANIYEKELDESFFDKHGVAMLDT